MANTDEMARARYRLLLRSLEAEGAGDRGGWQVEAAQRLDISQGLVSKIARGLREPGLSTIAKAIDRLRIRREFFYEPSLGDDLDYREARLKREQEQGG